MLVRLNRIDLDSEALAKPIPALTERQFVVAKFKRSSEEERLERELFWYREELLRRIKLTWSEVRFPFPRIASPLPAEPLPLVPQIGTLRSGNVSLRELYLDEPMLDILRGDDLEVELYLDDNPSAEPGAFELQGRGQRLLYSAAADEFIDVCVRITNRSRTFYSPPFCAASNIPLTRPLLLRAATPLSLSLRLELRPPTSSSHSGTSISSSTALATSSAALSHLARYVVIEGVSPVALPVLKAGGSTTTRVSVCLLARGRYELGVVVGERKKGGGGGGAALKSWNAREPLSIEVDR